jgi:hypothetical protein
MIGAFIFLLSRSFVNRTKARLKRLRQPKYLIGALFGLFCFYAYFFRFLFRRGQPGGKAIEDASLVIGGIGSLKGALIAALLIGFVDTFGKVLVPEFASIAVYLLMAVVLLFRPLGLFGRA